MLVGWLGDCSLPGTLMGFEYGDIGGLITPHLPPLPLPVSKLSEALIQEAEGPNEALWAGKSPFLLPLLSSHPMLLSLPSEYSPSPTASPLPESLPAGASIRSPPCGSGYSTALSEGLGPEPGHPSSKPPWLASGERTVERRLPGQSYEATDRLFSGPVAGKEFSQGGLPHH